MTPSDARHRQGLLLAAAGAVAFSGKAIIVKLCLRQGVDPVTLIMYRMLFALPVFALLGWWTGRRGPALTRRDWLVAGGLGFSGYYLASTLDFMGLQFVSAGLERLILYLNPTLVLALSVLLRRQPRITRAQGAALGLSYTGVALVFAHEVDFGSGGSGGSGGADTLLGAALVFGSAVSYAVYLVHSAGEVGRLGALRLTGVASSIACVLSLLQFALLRPLAAAVVPTPVLWLSLLNATACTVVPVVLVMMAMERIGAPLVAQTGMIGPLSTVLLAALLLGEPFGGWAVAGTTLVLAGIWLLARRR